MEKSKEAGFKLKGFKVIHSEITLNSSFSKFENLKINFSIKGEKDKSQFTLYLETEVFDSEKNLYIKVNTEGYYEFSEDIPSTNLGKFFTVNAPAILFPYVRAYISTLTSLSGIGGNVLLPTLNLVNLGKELEQNITDITDKSDKTDKTE